MYLGDFTVQIVEKPGSFLHRVYLMKHSRDLTEFFTHEAMVVTVKSGDRIEDDKVYFAEMSPDQLQAFADALANKGIKTHKDSVAEGKLAATEKHLEDMRKITLKKLGIE